MQQHNLHNNNDIDDNKNSTEVITLIYLKYKLYHNKTLQCNIFIHPIMSIEYICNNKRLQKYSINHLAKSCCFYF